MKNAIPLSAFIRFSSGKKMTGGKQQNIMDVISFAKEQSFDGIDL
ncbi:hypothetical protein P9B58_18330 [Bacillus mojavensis]|nr:hypothetical protein [Bacillus mojavensis]MEC1682262.1 hypothetical protein [Bacillus mojavensis]MEC1692144.1 hypothetical protein [Bacillus mojavensis]MEC1706011.1 hypothetical protein [Bacillus mojavensis]MEC1706826.1 hypothetical protein [Bacillus mojavensis]